MIDNFDQLPWHDAELLDLWVDRRKPGENDEVRLKVIWPDGEEATVLFCNCYALATEMNFGVIAEERIANASVLENDPYLIAIRDRWKLLGIALDALRCYRLETSSTSSIIRIYASQILVLPRPTSG